MNPVMQAVRQNTFSFLTFCTTLPSDVRHARLCPPSDLQRALFKTLDALPGVRDPEAQSSAAPRQHVFQALSYARRVCTHPYLLLKGQDEASLPADVRQLLRARPARDLSHAPKLKALLELLAECGLAGPGSELDDTQGWGGEAGGTNLHAGRKRQRRECDQEGHGRESVANCPCKCLIFVQMTETLALLEELLFKARFTYFLFVLCCVLIHVVLITLAIAASSTGSSLSAA
jgi:SNF2 family DNA or RNA helicase